MKAPGGTALAGFGGGRSAGGLNEIVDGALEAAAAGGGVTGCVGGGADVDGVAGAGAALTLGGAGDSSGFGAAGVGALLSVRSPFELNRPFTSSGTSMRFTGA